MDKAALRGFYSFLVTHRDYKTCLTKSVSYKTIHDTFGWASEKTRRMIKTLEDLGLIEYYSGFGFGDSGTTSIYAFPLETFKYGGNVIKSELPESLKQKNLEKAVKLSTTESVETEVVTEVTKQSSDDTPLPSTERPVLSKAEMLNRLKQKGEGKLEEIQIQS